MQKRSNPFDKKINPAPKEVEKPKIEKKIEKKPEIKVQKPIEEPKIAQKQVNIQYFDEKNKDKFTSTMDKTLRRTIKIICAQRGIMFTQFVEEACREKISREEGR